MSAEEKKMNNKARQKLFRTTHKRMWIDNETVAKIEYYKKIHPGCTKQGKQYENAIVFKEVFRDYPTGDREKKKKRSSGDKGKFQYLVQ